MLSGLSGVPVAQASKQAGKQASQQACQQADTMNAEIRPTMVIDSLRAGTDWCAGQT
jgi:hypothetical protein